MRRLILLFTVLVISALCQAQRNFELSCPAGSSDMLGPTFNPSTGKFRSWLCVDAFGQVSSPVFGTVGGSVTTTGTPAAGELAVFSGANTITNGNLSGPVTTSNGTTTTIGAGVVTNANLVNSSITISGQTCTLGSSCAVASVNSPQRVTLGSPIVLVANSQTIILTELVSFPSGSGTYRADVRYGAWITAAANACAAEVIDTTNSRPWALSGQDANGSGFIALSGSEISSQTYAAGATATITLQVQCNAAQTVTVSSGLFTFTPSEPTFLSVTPVLSN